MHKDRKERHGIAEISGRKICTRYYSNEEQPLMSGVDDMEYRSPSSLITNICLSLELITARGPVSITNTPFKGYRNRRRTYLLFFIPFLIFRVLQVAKETAVCTVCTYTKSDSFQQTDVFNYVIYCTDAGAYQEDEYVVHPIYKDGTFF